MSSKKSLRIILHRENELLGAAKFIRYTHTIYSLNNVQVIFVEIKNISKERAAGNAAMSSIAA